MARGSRQAARAAAWGLLAVLAVASALVLVSGVDRSRYLAPAGQSILGEVARSHETEAAAVRAETRGLRAEIWAISGAIATAFVRVRDSFCTTPDGATTATVSPGVRA